MNLNEAAGYPIALGIARQRVKPYRDTVKRDAHRKNWWRYGDWRPGLYQAICALDRVLVVGLTSKHLTFAFVPACYVFDQTTVVIASDRWTMFSMLSSGPHLQWALRHGANLGGTPRYNPSRCLETFPFPERLDSCLRLKEAGERLLDLRTGIMSRNAEGLTKVYNRFHDPEEASPDLGRLRELHDALDSAVLDAYGWSDIRSHCQFIPEFEEEEDEEGHQHRKKYRYRWPDEIRDEVLARLLELNRIRAGEEAQSDAAAPAVKTVGKRSRNSTKNAPVANHNLFDV